MKKNCRRIYHYLVLYGFSAAKALEICIDARRGDPYALQMVHIMFAMRDDFRGNDMHNLERRAYS